MEVSIVFFFVEILMKFSQNIIRNLVEYTFETLNFPKCSQLFCFENIAQKNKLKPCQFLFCCHNLVASCYATT